MAEDNFLCPSFSRLGPALKYIKCCLEVSCAVGGRLFTRLWPRIISYVGIFVSLRTADAFPVVASLPPKNNRELKHGSF